MFEQKAGAYAVGRAGYAPEVVERIVGFLEGTGSKQVADMGSGTGIFSEALLAGGCKVYGVEPLAQMRHKAEQRLAGMQTFVSVAASAEQSTLPAGSVDAVCAASAFHWFAQEAFQIECRRVLRAGGRVFLLVNAREMDEFTLEQADICRTHCEHFESFSHGGDLTNAACTTFFPKGYVRESFVHDLSYTAEQFLARSLSSSYAPKVGDAFYAHYVQALRTVIEHHCADGQILVRNKTVLWHGVM